MVTVLVFSLSAFYPFNISRDAKSCLFEKVNLEPKKQGQSNGQNTISGGFLDNAHRLKIGDEKIEFTPGHAELIRFMARELSNPSQDFLYLQHIPAYHYGDPGAINKNDLLIKIKFPKNSL